MIRLSDTQMFLSQLVKIFYELRFSYKLINNSNKFPYHARRAAAAPVYSIAAQCGRGTEGNCSFIISLPAFFHSAHFFIQLNFSCSLLFYSAFLLSLIFHSAQVFTEPVFTQPIFFTQSVFFYPADLFTQLDFSLSPYFYSAGFLTPSLSFFPP